MIIYRPTDKLVVTIGELKILVSPLTYSQRTDLLTGERMEAGKVKADKVRSAFLTLKKTIKSIKGFPEDATYPDGSKVELHWEENGELTEDSLEILIQVIGFSQASLVSSKIFLGDFKNTLEDVVFEPLKNEQEKKA